MLMLGRTRRAPGIRSLYPRIHYLIQLSQLRTQEDINKFKKFFTTLDDPSSTSAYAHTAGKGKISVSSSLTLSDVLHVPHLTINLLSISSLPKSLNCSVTFYPSHCNFQDLETKKMIGSGREVGGLYLSDSYAPLSIPRALMSQSRTIVDNKNRIMRWHLRLGGNFMQKLLQMYLLDRPHQWTILHQQEGLKPLFDNRLLEEKFISSIFVAMTSKLDDRKVLEWLNDADSGAIGVQGSNGNTRTWIQHFLDSNVVDSNVFDIVIWVDGSPWMGDVQLQIMDQIKLLLLKGGNEKEDEDEKDDDEEEDDDDEESDNDEDDDDDDDVDPELINARMGILLSDLGQGLEEGLDVVDGREEMIFASVAGKRVLLILDDMDWHGIDLLGFLGFPEHVNDNFVVLHTRDKQKAEFIDRVFYLDEYLFVEAFALFEKLSGVAFHSPGGPFDSLYLHALAEALVKDCNGGYLDISILAGTFRNLRGDYSPTLDAEHLKQLIELRKIYSMDSKKICCEMLPSNTMKDCFLYCKQYYRIYHRINVNRLISAWIREGFLCGFIYFENAFDNGNNVLEELANRFLLYRLNENNVSYFWPIFYQEGNCWSIIFSTI
ncbi:hypothetical protein GIB67_032328 [Kingdonia uniflora]|uniref:NB-ARC domain-containing protein n=1 Tax=Kingdonia uniflora TaxID=39325 RepID=A0A7J7MXK6_9MAGN|nr:hypothetical protein GIB67_032328 [Kingdonia uniflora]